MLCPNCGWDNPAESNTCMHCGAPLSPETPQTPSTVSPAPPPEPAPPAPTPPPPSDWTFEEEAPRRSHGPLVVLMVVLVLAAAAFGLCFGWYQGSGAWPWETLYATPDSTQSMAASSAASASSSVPAGYDAAALAAAVRQSNFTDFRVAESEISDIRTDDNYADRITYRFTVTKPMATLHMEIGIPADSSSGFSRPRVTNWAVDTWNLTGVWNDETGNSLVIAECADGEISGSYVPKGSFSGTPLSGTLSEEGVVSLLGSRLNISGTFSPAGTAQLSVQTGSAASRETAFVMLSTAVPTVQQQTSSRPSSANTSSGGSTLHEGDVFPESSERLLNTLDFVPVLFSGQAKEQLALARNEIYARHGFDFQTEPYRSHFYSLPWYQALPKVKQVPESELSEIERQNITKIQEYESRYN